MPDSGSLVALYIDLENMYFSIRNHHPDGTLDPAEIGRAAQAYGPVICASAFADESRQTSSMKSALANAHIDFVHVPLNHVGKSRADSAIMLSALELSLQQPEIDTYVFATGDFDFVSIVERLRRKGKHVVVLGITGTMSQALVEAADEATVLPFRSSMTPQEQGALHFLAWIDQRWKKRHCSSIAHYMASPRNPTGFPLTLPQAHALLRSFLDKGALTTSPGGTVRLNPAHPWVQSLHRHAA